MQKFKRSSRVGPRSVRTEDKIKAKRELIESLGADWNKMTQKQLDEFWESNCDTYVLIHVNGKGLKYVPFEAIESEGLVN